jgi:peptidoglycan/xylan/chitin deacetylase (PgdA/CDA1 family)
MTGVKTLAKAALCGVYKYSGALRAQETVARWAGRQFMAVLLFHRVTDAIPEDGLTVGTERFRRICRLLQRKFRVVPLAEVFRIRRRGEPMPPRTVAITFDDCYRDNLFAARVLAEYGLPATFFVPTAFVDTDRVFAWDRGLPRMANLTWDDLAEMQRLGFEVGSHTVNHANLGVVPREQACKEIFESKLVLEERLGKPVRWFAYPFGGLHHLRAELVPVIQAAGYEGALSAFGGLVYPGTDDRVLPREAVPYFRSVLNLELHLTGCLHWVYALKRALGRGELPRNAWPGCECAWTEQAPEQVLATTARTGQG